MNDDRRIAMTISELRAAPRRGKLALGLTVLAIAIVVLAAMYLMQGAPSSAALGVSLTVLAAVIVPFGLSRAPHEAGAIKANLVAERLIFRANRSSLFWGLALAMASAVAAWALFIGATDPRLDTGRYVLVGTVILGLAAGGGIYQAILAARAIGMTLDRHGVQATRGAAEVATVSWSALAAATASATHLTLFPAADGSASGLLTWDVRLLESDPQAVAKLINESIEAGAFSPDSFA